MVFTCRLHGESPFLPLCVSVPVPRMHEGYFKAGLFGQIPGSMGRFLVFSPP